MSDIQVKTGYLKDEETNEIFLPRTDSSLVTGLEDLATIRQKSNSAYQKPQSGIPASDLASGVIPDVSQFITASVNNLVNYYLKSETYTKAEVQSLIGAINQFHYEIAASTSAVVSPENNVLYLIGPTGSGADKYEEYVYPNSTQGWVKIGDTSIDLSGYVTTQALNTALADYTATANLAAVALSGSFGDLTTKPDTDTFVKSYPGATSKLVTTTVPYVTSVGAPSTWNFSLGSGNHAHALIISGDNGSRPSLGTPKTVATGSLDANGDGASVMTGLGTPATGMAYVKFLSLAGGGSND